MLVVLMVSLIYSVFPKIPKMFPYVMKISIILVFFVLFPQDKTKALYLAAGSDLQINDSFLPANLYILIKFRMWDQLGPYKRKKVSEEEKREKYVMDRVQKCCLWQARE